MDKNSFAKNLVMLNILSQSACECVESKPSKKNFLSVATKILFLVDNYERVSPTFLTQKLRIAKSNIALMCNKLVQDSLLIHTQDLKDKRIVFYTLTDAGREALNQKLSEIQNSLEAVCMTDNIENINSCVQDVNQMLSKRF